MRPRQPMRFSPYSTRRCHARSDCAQRYLSRQQAIESKATHDDTKWLTFWFVHSIFSLVNTIVKTACGFVAYSIPFYGEVYFVFLGVLAFGGGARALYRAVLRPLLLKYESRLDAGLESVPGKSGLMKAAADAEEKGYVAFKG